MRPTEEILQYVESFGLYFEQFSLPRTAGRILGWLLICDPPHQTMHELVDVLQVSKSSISTASRLLIQTGLVDKVSLPGERRDYYRINKDAWMRAWQMKLKETSVMREMAAQGLQLLADKSPEQKHRLKDMHNLYQFLEREFPLLIERWQEEHDE